jgi:hypothetical protein
MINKQEIKVKIKIKIKEVKIAIVIKIGEEEALAQEEIEITDLTMNIRGTKKLMKRVIFLITGMTVIRITHQKKRERVNI